MNPKSVSLMRIAALAALSAGRRLERQRVRRRTEVPDRLRRSWQHAALQPDKGEGFENKIAQVIGKSLGTGVNITGGPRSSAG